jgi:aldehyde oxidoreductase
MTISPSKIGMDPLEFRILNALDNDSPTVTGQVLGEGVGIRACLEALRPQWTVGSRSASGVQCASWYLRRGVGIAGMWYGCGNTSLPNPSTVRIGLKRDGRIALHQGAVDIGQGSNTIVTQICADALGAPISQFDLVSGDTSITPDCGKTSASRQTFVTGKAAHMAGRKLRDEILKLAGACKCAAVEFGNGFVTVLEDGKRKAVDLSSLPLDQHGYVITSEATFDPPITPLDENGQGNPYAVYGFGAHMAEVEVDVELGTVRVLKVTAAHDVGRAINPTLIEGQIEGGVAQGLGMALMEEFFPGQGRESARLSDSVRRRHSADRVNPDRRSVARSVRSARKELASRQSSPLRLRFSMRFMMRLACAFTRLPRRPIGCERPFSTKASGGARE